MKVTGATSSKSASAARGAKGSTAAGGGFSLGPTGGAAEASGAAPAAGVGGVSSLGALLALQAVDDPLERRRRAVHRAGRILDALDGLKIALLEGSASPAGLHALLAAVREERGATDDVRLQGILNEIETRAAVELAKRGQAVAA